MGISSVSIILFYSSGLWIIQRLVRLKIGQVSSAILLQYLDFAIDLLYNTPIPVVKMATLNFLEAIFLIFPRAIESKLEQVRDAVR